MKPGWICVLVVTLCLNVAFPQNTSFAATPATQPAAATQPALQIISARWGAGRRWLDVTSEIRKHINNDQLDMKVDPSEFTPDPAPRQRKQLQITYSLNGEKNTVTFPPQSQAWIAAVSREEADANRQAADARKSHPTGLLIVSAKYGSGNRWADVTQNLQNIVTDNSLTVKVSDAAFGDPAPGSTKQLKITYDDGGTRATKTYAGGQTLQIGPKEIPTLARGGQIINLLDRAANLKKQYGDVLLVLDARFGEGNRWRDVTDDLQKTVKGKGLSVYVGTETFGDPAPGQAFKKLEIWYSDATGVHFQTASEGKSYSFGNAATSDIAKADSPRPSPRNNAVARNDVPKRSGSSPRTSEKPTPADATTDQMARVEELRKKYGDGLLILEAKFGSGNRWMDVSDRLQSQVTGNALTTRSRSEDWGDPAPGSTKDVVITYWDGRTIKHTKVPGGNLILLEGVKPEALAALTTFPRFVIEAKPVVHSFGGAGTFALTTGPTGLTLDPHGVVRWTPVAAQVGGQEFTYTYAAGGKTYYGHEWFEVVNATAAAPAQGDLKKLEAVMRLPIAGGKDAKYAVNLETKDALLIDGDKLTVIAPDGTLPLRSLQLQHPYVTIGERNEYFMGIRVRPMAEDLIDKQTGKVIKTVPLVYREPKDVAFMPGHPFTFISVAARPSVPHDQIVVIKESTGEATSPKDLSGTFLQFDRTGRNLWVGIKDIYQTGMEYHINPDWNIIEIPQYGNIDMLLRFDMAGGNMVLKETIRHAGGNGFGIRVAPDGSRVAYLSFTGFPEFTKTVPAWDANNFSREPVGYPLKRETHSLAFHPTLPLVAIPHADGVLMFNRDTGEPDSAHVKLSAGALAATEVDDVFFSPDGKNLILQCNKGGTRWLYKVPLILTPDEFKKASTDAPTLPDRNTQPRDLGIKRG